MVCAILNLLIRGIQTPSQMLKNVKLGNWHWISYIYILAIDFHYIKIIILNTIFAFSELHILKLTLSSTGHNLLPYISLHYFITRIFYHYTSNSPPHVMMMIA